MSGVSVLVLTKDEERNLPGCLASVSWCDDVVVLDSRSTDRTREVARLQSARVAVRDFDDWATHQNWALANLEFAHPWVLYLDADERVTPALAAAVRRAAGVPGECAAFAVRRRDFFMGRWLRHAQMTPWLLRLFRPERVRYERLVNPVTVVDGPAGRLDGYLDHFPFSKGMDHWLDRHCWYARLEAEQHLAELETGNAAAAALRLLAAPGRRRQGLKRLFNLLPARPAIRFSWMYLAKRGFLDGGPGLRYCLLQARYQRCIDAEIKRLRRR